MVNNHVNKNHLLSGNRASTDNLCFSSMDYNYDDEWINTGHIIRKIRSTLSHIIHQLSGFSSLLLVRSQHFFPDVSPVLC